jgi:hypothetical protein
MSLACSQDASPLHAAVRMSDTAAIRAYLDARLGRSIETRAEKGAPDYLLRDFGQSEVGFLP